MGRSAAARRDRTGGSVGPSFETEILDMIDGAPAAPVFARVFEPVVAQGIAVSGMQLYRYDPGRPEPVTHCFSLGVDPELVDVVTQDFMGPEGNPVVQSLPRAGLDRLRHVGEITDWDAYLRSPVHRAFAEPAGTRAPGVLLHVGGTGAYMTALGIAREDDWPDARTRREVEARFVRYLRALGCALGNEVAESAPSRPGVAGCIVLSARGMVIRLPRTSGMDGGALRIAGGRVLASVAEGQPLLDDALAEALHGGERALVLPGRDGRLHEVRLRAGPSFLGEATAIVDCRPVSGLPWSGASLTLAYGLTPRESEITLDLLGGDSVAEIADRRRIRAGTVRIYLRHVFAKTGTRGQAHLVAVLNGAASPTG